MVVMGERRRLIGGRGMGLVDTFAQLALENAQVHGKIDASQGWGLQASGSAQVQSGAVLFGFAGINEAGPGRKVQPL